MGKVCKVLVNGDIFSANYGDLLLDAALANGIDLPFDCRSGYCGTCCVRVVQGRVFGGESSDPDTVHACQCRIISDLEVAVEETPDVVAQSGQVAKLATLAPDVVEVVIELPQPADYLPGQYYRLQFRGFPSRCFSATPPLVGARNSSLVRFHVRRVPHGRVSSALGGKIRPGHRVKLVGPLGSAFLRPDLTNRLVLVASGTGFAPIWAIADAAMREWSERDLVMVVAARKLVSLYMIPALCRLARCPNVVIIPVVSEPQNLSKALRGGRPTDYLPALSAQDIVYTAGAPAMVEAVARLAKAAGAKCFTDPFEAAANRNDDEGLLSRAVSWFTGGPVVSSASIAPAATRPARTLGPDTAPRTRRPPPGSRHRPAWLGEREP